MAGLREIALAVITVVAVACRDTGGQASGGGTGAGTGTQDGGTAAVDDGTVPDGAAADAVRDLIEAQCSWLFACCERGEIDLAVGPFTESVDDCVARALSALGSGSMDSPVEAGPSDLLLYLTFSYDASRIEFDDDAVRECATWLSGAACNEPPPQDLPEGSCVPDDEPVDDPCEVSRLIRGLQPAGDACNPTLPSECEPGLTCVGFATEGVCAVLADEGEYCFSDGECRAGLVCDALGGTCQPASSLGQPCAYFDPANPLPGTETKRCVAELSCDPVTLVCVGGCALGSTCSTDSECLEEHVCAVGRCLPPQPSGANCDDDPDCESGSCEIEGTCAPLLGPGQSCVTHERCSTGFCDPLPDTCSPTQPNGQACTTSRDEECEDGFCDTTQTPSLCAPYLGAGATCTSISQCDPAAELTCAGGMCVALPLPDGTGCVDDDQCISTLCMASVCETRAQAGDVCDDADPAVKPCALDAYCEAPAGGEGTCATKRGSGDVCQNSTQCWGSCTVAWGAPRCDETPATGAALCDGR